MRTVRSDRELELEQQLVRRRTDRVVRPPVLAPDLAELARPVRERQRAAGVEKSGIGRAVRSVVARASEPAPPELVVARHVEAVRSLQALLLIAAAPDVLRPSDERP